MSAGQPIYQNAFVQQNAFLSVNNRQNLIFMGPPTPAEPEATVYSSGGQPPAPGAPGAGAVAVAASASIPAFLTEPAPIYIGSRRTKQNESQRGRSNLRKTIKPSKTTTSNIATRPIPDVTPLIPNEPEEEK